MLERDYDPFVAILDEAAKALPNGKPLTPEQISVSWEALQPFTIAQVRTGVLSHQRDPQRGRFMPTAADIIDQVQRLASSDGRPGPEEAWALCPKSDADSVVWTEEMAAAFEVVHDMIAADEVAARMAFKEVYAARVADARGAGIAPQWTPALGSSEAGRVRAMQAAVAARRITVAGALDLGVQLQALPAPEPEPLRIDETPEQRKSRAERAAEQRQQAAKRLKAFAESLRGRSPDDSAMRALDARRDAGEHLTAGQLLALANWRGGEFFRPGWNGVTHFTPAQFPDGSAPDTQQQRESQR